MLWLEMQVEPILRASVVWQTGLTPTRKHNFREKADQRFPSWGINSNVLGNETLES